MRKQFLRFYKMAMLALLFCFAGLARDTARAEDDTWKWMPSMWQDYGTIAYSFPSGEDPISCSVTEAQADQSAGGTIDIIPSNQVAITVDGESIDPSCYTISVEEDPGSPGTWRLTGIWNSVDLVGYADSSWSLPDFFRDKSDLPVIQEAEEPGPPALDDLSYWDITVDSAGCSFAAGYDPRPVVTIRAIDGSVELEEGVDFKVDTSLSGPKRCGSANRLRIYWVDTSQKCSDVAASKGYIEQKYTIHYSDIGEYYDLEGLPDTVYYSLRTPVPELLSKSNGYDAGTTDMSSLDGYLYLSPKKDAARMGARPSLSDPSMILAALWNASGCLKVSYQYDGSTWKDEFDLREWEKWRKTHQSDTVLVKVSVDESKGNGYFVNQYNADVARYLTGSITKSIRILPYSLSEKNPSAYPPTESVNGYSIFARINPQPVADSRLPGSLYYSSVGEKAIDSVVYNGKAQKPAFTLGLYTYGNVGLGSSILSTTDYTGAASPDDPKLASLIQSVSYSDNIDAGTASVTVSFKGLFTGSIKRQFTIEPKSIADPSIKVQVKEEGLYYTGEQLLPELTVEDTAAGTVLEEGKDYKTEVVSGGIQPGTAVLKISGINNYTGEQANITYEILAGEGENESGSESEEILPADPFVVKVRNQKSLRLKWQEMAGYEGYQLYMAPKRNGSYKKVADVKKSTAAVRNLKAGSTYFFKVRAYKRVNGKKQFSDFSEVMAVCTRLTQPKITSAKSTKAGRVNIKWRRDTKASGYSIYMRKAGVHEFTFAGDVKGGRNTSCTLKGLKSGKNIFVRIRSFKTVEGKRIYSSYSEKVKVRVK